MRLYACMYTFRQTCMCVCMYIDMCVHAGIYECIYVARYTYVCVCVNACLSIHMYACVHACVPNLYFSVTVHIFDR